MGRLMVSRTDGDLPSPLPRAGVVPVHTGTFLNLHTEVFETDTRGREERRVTVSSAPSTKHGHAPRSIESKERELSICQSLRAERTRQMTLPTENGHAAPPVESRKRVVNLSILTVCQNLVSFLVLRHIEPQAPLLGGAHEDILQNWDSNDCRRIDHLTLF